MRKTVDGISSTNTRLQVTMHIKTLELICRTTHSFDDLPGLVRVAELKVTPLGIVDNSHVPKLS